MKLPLLPEHRECEECELHEDARNPGIGTRRVKVSLDPAPDVPAVLFLGQNPGFEEDFKGQAFVGKSGKVLTTAYVGGSGVLPRASVYLSNGVRCFTVGNATPNLRHYKACMSYTIDDLQSIAEVHNQAKLIVVATGGPACNAIHRYVLDRKGNLSLAKAFLSNGTVCRLPSSDTFPDGYPFTFFVTFHPAYILRDRKHIHAVQSHMQLVVDCLDGVLAEPSDPELVDPYPP